MKDKTRVILNNCHTLNFNKPTGILTSTSVYRSRSQSLKHYKSTTSGCKVIGIIKLEIVTDVQLSFINKNVIQFKGSVTVANLEQSGIHRVIPWA